MSVPDEELREILAGGARSGPDLPTAAPPAERCCIAREDIAERLGALFPSRHVSLVVPDPRDQTRLDVCISVHFKFMTDVDGARRSVHVGQCTLTPDGKGIAHVEITTMPDTVDYLLTRQHPELFTRAPTPPSAVTMSSQVI